MTRLGAFVAASLVSGARSALACAAAEDASLGAGEEEQECGDGVEELHVDLESCLCGV